MLIKQNKPVKHSYTEVAPIKAWLEYNNIITPAISYNDVYDFFDIELAYDDKEFWDILAMEQTPEFKYNCIKAWKWKYNECIPEFRLCIYYTDEVLQNVKRRSDPTSEAT